MKILETRYPKGTFKGQKTDGRYIDENLNSNIKLLAKHIKRDMTYLGIISSSTLEVGTGKSVFIQQFAEAFLEGVREYHGIDNRLSMKNIVFSPKDLIDRAFKLPKYSVILLDEWEDSHYWSQLGMSLRQFFRKCRQLNLLILCVIPNLFQLGMNYSVSRSLFFIDILFQNEFERGFFKFYNFQSKRKLFLMGKKQQNYGCVKPDFIGRFLDGYVVDEAEYRRAKRLDMEKYDEETKPITEKQIKIKLFNQLNLNLVKVTIKELSKAFGIGESTAYRWLQEGEKKETKT